MDVRSEEEKNLEKSIYKKRLEKKYLSTLISRMNKAQLKLLSNLIRNLILENWFTLKLEKPQD